MIFRVYNGWMGNGPIHRIVQATDEAEAIRKAGLAWGTENFKRFTAEEIDLDEHGVERQEQDL